MEKLNIAIHIRYIIIAHCIVRWLMEQDRDYAIGKTQVKAVNSMYDSRTNKIIACICSLQGGMVSCFHAFKPFCVIFVKQGSLMLLWQPKLELTHHF